MQGEGAVGVEMKLPEPLKKIFAIHFPLGSAQYGKRVRQMRPFFGHIPIGSICY